MLIVGLTGGIATGKSTVSKRLKEKHGLPIVDADVIARQVVEPGTAAYNKIVAHFGPLNPNLLHPDGSLNRPALGQTVFGNEKERKVLNSIVHPAVRYEIARQVLWHWFTGRRLIILDVPLLFESKLDRFCGTTVVVSCSDERQLDRLLKRDPHLSKTDAEQRIGSQMSIEEKSQLADHTIDNNGSLDELFSNLDKLVTSLTPNILLSSAEWLVPPFGLLMAIYTYYSRPVRKSRL
jgi:dephospho-CoA kinase